MKKRGELTTQQLVVIIILIISFVVVLFLLFRLGLGEETNKEICHNSVVMKSKSLIKSGAVDCKTTYVCIGKECEGFVATINVDVKTEEEIVEAIEKEIKDCDWMFGEKKIDYVGFGDRSALGQTNCAICSSIQFDKDVQNKFSNINFNGKSILTNEKYSVVTGMKSGIAWGIGSEELFIGPDIVKSNEIGSFECDKFIHKA